MSRESFQNWEESRRNQTITSENLDEVLGSLSKIGSGIKKLFAGRTPTDPSQIYNHPKVNRWYHQWMQDLDLNDPSKIEQIDGTPYPGVSKDVEDSMKRFIAANLFGGGKGTPVDWLQISYADGVKIFKFLDSIKKTGSQQSLADDLNIDGPQYLVHWYRGRYGSKGDAWLQQDYGKRSSDFQVRRGTSKRASVPPSSLPQELSNMSQALRSAEQILQVMKDKYLGKKKFSTAFENEVVSVHNQIETLLSSLKRPSTPGPTPVPMNRP